MIRFPGCPICKKPLPADPASAETPHAPFCSERCRQVDLLRWFDGRYAIVEPLNPDTELSPDADQGDPEPEE